MPENGAEQQPQKKELEMEKNYSIVITFDNGDPSVYGPYSSEQEASLRLDQIQSKWDDWYWQHQTGSTVREMSK